MTLDVLAGARCRVTETEARGATVMITESGGTADGNRADGVVTVDSTQTVTVTNAFPSVAGGGSGFLAGTGRGVAALVGIASLMVAAGLLALVVLRRRERRIGR